MGITFPPAQIWHYVLAWRESGGGSFHATPGVSTSAGPAGNDELYETNELRVINRTSLIPIIAVEIASRTTVWWVENLEKVSVPSGPVNSLEDVFNHPQIKHREMVKELTDTTDNLIKTVASPINMSATPLQYHSPSPELGQHTVKILKEQLNYDEEMILKAFKNEVVG